jgi:hypothetical protein
MSLIEPAGREGTLAQVVGCCLAKPSCPWSRSAERTLQQNRLQLTVEESVRPMLFEIGLHLRTRVNH